MSNNTGNDVLEILRRAVEDVALPVSEAFQGLEGLAPARQVEELMSTGSQNASSLLSSVVSGQASSGSGAASWVSWVNPLVGGLMSLFGGGGSDDAQETLVPFVRPAKQSYNAGFSESDGSLMLPLDRGDDGRVRNQAANVTVQVEAMDSRSFVDRAPEIAQAVKRALLESQGLSGVMQEF